MAKTRISPMEGETPEECMQRISAVAHAAFDAYSNLESPGPGRYESNKFWKRFIQVASIVSENGWDAWDYVQYAVESAKRTRFAVTPADLVKDAFIIGYGMNLDKYDAKSEWNGAVAMLTNLEMQGSSEKDVLMNVQIPLPAWFRCAWPSDDFPLKDVVSTFGEIAKDEYDKYKSIRDFMDEKVPGEAERLGWK